MLIGHWSAYSKSISHWPMFLCSFWLSPFMSFSVFFRLLTSCIPLPLLHTQDHLNNTQTSPIWGASWQIFCRPNFAHHFVPKSRPSIDRTTATFSCPIPEACFRFDWFCFPCFRRYLEEKQKSPLIIIYMLRSWRVILLARLSVFLFHVKDCVCHPRCTQNGSFI